LCSPEILTISGGPAVAPGFTTGQWDLELTEVPGGKQVTVSCLVTNTGTEPATYRDTLVINGIERDTQEVSLAGGESKVISFSVLMSEPGDYTATIGDTTLSFSVPGETSGVSGETSGDGGFSGLLLIGAVLGAGLLVAIPVTTVVIRRRRRRSATLSGVSEPEAPPAPRPPEPAPKPVPRPPEPAPEPAPGPAEAEPNRVEYDLGGGILTVTKGAIRHLLDSIRAKTADPAFAIRIVRSSTVPTQFRMLIDSQHPDDIVFYNNGVKMLLLGPDVLKILEGVTIDFQESEHGGTFSLSRSQPQG
jgi:Fe-S cluster assembly iron-binding protein IscA